MRAAGEIRQQTRCRLQVMGGNSAEIPSLPRVVNPHGPLGRIRLDGVSSGHDGNMAA